MSNTVPITSHTAAPATMSAPTLVSATTPNKAPKKRDADDISTSGPDGKPEPKTKPAPKPRKRAKTAGDDPAPAALQPLFGNNAPDVQMEDAPAMTPIPAKSAKAKGKEMVASKPQTSKASALQRAAIKARMQQRAAEDAVGNQMATDIANATPSSTQAPGVSAGGKFWYFSRTTLNNILSFVPCRNTPFGDQAFRASEWGPSW